jgi:hypothetical protein
LRSSIVWRWFRKDTDLTCVSETGRVLQKKQLNNSDRFLSGQDTGRPTDNASSGFFFLFSTTFSWASGTPEPLGDFDLHKTPPPNFSGTVALSPDHWEASKTAELRRRCRRPLHAAGRRTGPGRPQARSTPCGTAIAPRNTHPPHPRSVIAGIAASVSLMGRVLRCVTKVMIRWHYPRNSHWMPSRFRA